MWAGPTQKNKKIQVRAACRLLLVAGDSLPTTGRRQLAVQDLHLRLGDAGPPGRSGPPGIQGRGQCYFNLISGLFYKFRLLQVYE